MAAKDKEYGYITISRRLFDGPLWSEERQLSLAEAWLWLIKEARFEVASAKELIGGKMVTWSRGQLPGSVRYLATRWHWTIGKVQRYLEMLEREEMIKRHIDGNSGQTIITLVNYEKYNGGKNSKRYTEQDAKSSTGQGLIENIDTPDDTLSDTGAIHRRYDTNTDNKRKEGRVADAPTHTDAELARFKNFQAYLDQQAPNVQKLKCPFTIDEYIRLFSDYPGPEAKKQILDVILAMHNSKTLLKKYESANLTCRSWLRIRLERQEPKSPQQNGQSDAARVAADLQEQQAREVLAAGRKQPPGES